MRLGQKIGEFTGRISSERVLASESEPVCHELSVTLTGTILGVEARQVGTFTNREREDGTVLGEGCGLFLTVDGERAEWRGSGLGKPTKGVTGQWINARFCEAPEGKLARLNRMMVLGDDTVDSNGNIKSEIYEVLLPE